MNLLRLGILLWRQCYFSQESASLLQESSSSVECEKHVIAMAQGLVNVIVFSSGWFAMNATLNTERVVCREGSCPCPDFYGAAKMTSDATQPPCLKDHSKIKALSPKKTRLL